MRYQCTRTALRQARAAHSESGFTLIEILISLIILAVGFLGLAALQTGSVQGTQTTYFRTQADLLVNDLAERMRSNRAGALNGHYAFASGGAPGDPGCSGAGGSCDSAALANSDLNEWVTWVNNSLPAGDAIVTQLDDTFWSIQVMWDERRNGAAGQGCDPANEDDLACLRINLEIREVDLSQTYTL